MAEVNDLKTTKLQKQHNKGLNSNLTLDNQTKCEYTDLNCKSNPELKFILQVRYKHTRTKFNPP